METSFVNNASQPPQNFADAFPCPLLGRMSVIAVPEGKADIMISILEMRKVALVTQRAGRARKVPFCSRPTRQACCMRGSSPPSLSPVRTSHLCWALGFGAHTALPHPSLPPASLKDACTGLRVPSVG